MLLNIALHGMEQAAGVRYQRHGVHAGGAEAGLPGSDPLRRRPARPLPVPGSRPSRSRSAWPSGWRPEGLAFNEDKTRIVYLDEGFDFLGFNVRRQSGKLLIKPSKAALRRHRQRLRSRDALPAGA